MKKSEELHNAGAATASVDSIINLILFTASTNTVSFTVSVRVASKQAYSPLVLIAMTHNTTSYNHFRAYLHLQVDPADPAPQHSPLVLRGLVAPPPAGPGFQQAPGDQAAHLFLGCHGPPSPQSSGRAKKRSEYKQICSGVKIGKKRVKHERNIQEVVEWVSNVAVVFLGCIYESYSVGGSKLSAYGLGGNTNKPKHN